MRTENPPAKLPIRGRKKRPRWIRARRSRKAERKDPDENWTAAAVQFCFMDVRRWGLFVKLNLQKKRRRGLCLATRNGTVLNTRRAQSMPSGAAPSQNLLKKSQSRRA